MIRDRGSNFTATFDAVLADAGRAAGHAGRLLNPENASPDPEDGAPEARRTVAAVMSSVYLGLAYRALSLLPGTLTGGRLGSVRSRAPC